MDAERKSITVVWVLSSVALAGLLFSVLKQENIRAMEFETKRAAHATKERGAQEVHRKARMEFDSLCTNDITLETKNGFVCIKKDAVVGRLLNE